MAEHHRTRLVAAGVTKRFAGGGRRPSHVAVDGVDLAIEAGRSIGIVGESGSGKSTLARLFLGLTSPSDGRIELDGEDLTEILSVRSRLVAFRRRVQFVAQDTTSSFDPRRSLGDTLARPARELLGMNGSDSAALAVRTVARLGLDPAMLSRLPGQVSGGQRQRFSLARALVVQPDVLVCDEVVSALDVSVQGAILNLLCDIRDEFGTSIVFVSHGLPATAFIADEIAVMYRGRLVEHGPTEQVVEHPQHDYTRRLLAAQTGPGDADAVLTAGVTP
ncbi:ATP-binding cassette domain-containing protein [Pseudonocardia sp. NPDC049635]|uniref:ABC transporter ATP-binding protein n=1 Tax=Pseudonocardia sp. NPDC049635 TaxID=3155506 RepID=UPI0033CF0D8E